MAINVSYHSGKTGGGPCCAYYQPTSLIPTSYVCTNIKDFWREYIGFELTVRKRYADKWQLNGNVSYNDAPVHFDSRDGYLWWVNNSDPTNIEETLNGAQYARSRRRAASTTCT